MGEVNTDIERDSVLKIAKDSFADIEIKPKPPGLDDDFVLETSQILIMVGSAFVSFGVVMLAFFMCRQTLDKKKHKSIPFIIPDPRVGREPTPIVKDYQRVPTDTKEYLQCREDTHIEMYGGKYAKCDAWLSQGLPLQNKLDSVTLIFFRRLIWAKSHPHTNKNMNICA